jgi:hypothetical protein
MPSPTEIPEFRVSASQLRPFFFSDAVRQEVGPMTKRLSEGFTEAASTIAPELWSVGKKHQN